MLILIVHHRLLRHHGLRCRARRLEIGPSAGRRGDPQPDHRHGRRPGRRRRHRQDHRATTPPRTSAGQQHREQSETGPATNIIGGIGVGFRVHRPPHPRHRRPAIYVANLGYAGSVRRGHRRAGHALHHGHPAGRRRLRADRRQRGRDRGDGGTRSRGSQPYRQPRRGGQHHRGHRQGALPSARRRWPRCRCSRPISRPPSGAPRWIADQARGDSSACFVGAMLPFLFSAMAMKAVGDAAMEMIQEVRRQFREIKETATGPTAREGGRGRGACPHGRGEASKSRGGQGDRCQEAWRSPPRPPSSA